MGVASERAVSIPQITYDHIDDSEEKKDVSYFQDEPRGTVDGNIIERALFFCYCIYQILIKSYFHLLEFQSEVYKLYCMVFKKSGNSHLLLFFEQLSPRHVNWPRLHMKALSPVLLLRV